MLPSPTLLDIWSDQLPKQRRVQFSTRTQSYLHCGNLFCTFSSGPARSAAHVRLKKIKGKDCCWDVLDHSLRFDVLIFSFSKVTTMSLGQPSNSIFLQTCIQTRTLGLIGETAFSMAVLENLNSYVCKLYPYCLYPISLCNPSLGQSMCPSVHHENSSHSPPSAM